MYINYFSSYRSRIPDYDHFVVVVSGWCCSQLSLLKAVPPYYDKCSSIVPLVNMAPV